MLAPVCAACLRIVNRLHILATIAGEKSGLARISHHPSAAVA